MSHTRTAMLVLAASLVPACGGSAAAEPEPPTGSRGVTQGGAQDIARFRSIVDGGDVPAMETLDEVGFFGEHALDQPEATCGEAVCVHGNVAVAPRFDGGNWTMAYVTLNSPIDPADRPRRPVHLIVALDDSTHSGSIVRAYDRGLRALGGELETEDRISVLIFGEDAKVLGVSMDADSGTFTDAIEQIGVGAVSDRANLHGALSSAVDVAREEPANRESRVILVTSGYADAGITDERRLIDIAEEAVADGVSMSIIGVGERFRSPIPVALGALGAGTYAYAEDEIDLVNVLTSEGRYSLAPIASELELTVRPAPGYTVGPTYGARRAQQRDDGSVVLSSPALFLGAREGASDTHLGRRGGGGGLFVQLLQEGGEVGSGADEPAFEIETRYVAEDSGEAVALDATVLNPLARGETPELWPEFADAERGKPFMMLNMYLALRAAVDFFERGDCARALGVVDMMRPGVELWQSRYRDPDIGADSMLMQLLQRNIDAQCEAEPIEPPDFAGGCFGI